MSESQAIKLPPAPEAPSHGGPRIWGCLFLLALIAVGAFFGGRYLIASSDPNKGDKKGGKDKPIPVAIAKVTEQSVPVEVNVVGSVTPLSTVPVTSQVGGVLVKVLIKQGDFVYNGQPLFLIDSRPEKASLDQAQAIVQKDQAQVGQATAAVTRDLAMISQAEATLAKDMAGVNQAKSNLAKDLAQLPYLRKELKRYQQLLSEGFVTPESAEQATANITSLEGTLAADRAAVQAAQSTVAADQASIASARATAVADGATVRSLASTVDADQAAAQNAAVQLTYTKISSPVKGRTGTLNIFEGTLVKANDTTPLITIDEIQPIRVTFAVPEKYLSEIRQNQERAPLAVTVHPADHKSQVEKGVVDFIENTVDATTGTITLRAQFPNLSRRLWPGQFVNVTLLLRTVANALTIPSPAVQPGPDGDFVFVVSPEKTVAVRKVQVDFTYGDISIIKSGLKAGETVVTDGQLQLTPGANITLEGRGKRGASGSPTPTPDGSASPAAQTPTDGSTPLTSTDVATPSDSPSPRHHHRHQSE